MKKFFINDNGDLGFDDETQELFAIESLREGISRIRLIEEPMQIVVKKYGKDYKLDAKKGDILITFYEDMFTYPAILVKSKDWVKNLKNYEERIQKDMKRWAEGANVECCNEAKIAN